MRGFILRMHENAEVRKGKQPAFGQSKMEFNSTLQQCTTRNGQIRITRYGEDNARFQYGDHLQHIVSRTV